MNRFKPISISLDDNHLFLLKTLCVLENRSASGMIQHLLITRWKSLSEEEKQPKKLQFAFEKIEVEKIKND